MTDPKERAEPDPRHEGPRALLPRPADKWPRLRPLREDEVDAPGAATVLRFIYHVFVRIFHDPAGMILGSTFLLLMLWGYHGRVELLGLVTDDWKGPGTWIAGRPQLIPGLPWDQEAISFAVGFVLVVLIPILLIKLVYKQRLRDYGLCLPPRNRWKVTLVGTGLLGLLAVIAVAFSHKDPEMRAEYPLFRDLAYLQQTGHFVLYELVYLLFFVCIEFIFRGYLLFGLYHVKDTEAAPGLSGVPGPLVFGYYAILISMLSYTAWHLGKPTGELYGTLVWGIASGAAALTCRSIWPVVLVHWLMNVFIDLTIIRGGF